MNNPTYLLFDGPSGPRRWITNYPFIDSNVWWDNGKAHTFPIPDSLSIEMDHLESGLEEEEIGPEMPPCFMGEIPLFRDDFILALKELGVNNLDLYNAVIKDPDDGKEYKNYKAVNIVGIFPAEVLGIKNPNEDIHIDFDFDHARLDSLNKNRLLMFRIKDATGIFVHKDIKESLAIKGYSQLKFINPTNAAL
jgi:hypothetical protein